MRRETRSELRAQCYYGEHDWCSGCDCPCHNAVVSDSLATLDVPPTPDIAAIETAAESLMRFGDIRNAIALWAIALRLREESK